MRGWSQPTPYAKHEVGDVGDSDDDSGCNIYDDFGCSEDDDVDNPSLDDEISRQIDIVDVDHDGNPTVNVWNKIYQMEACGQRI